MSVRPLGPANSALKVGLEPHARPPVPAWSVVNLGGAVPVGLFKVGLEPHARPPVPAWSVVNLGGTVAWSVVNLGGTVRWDRSGGGVAADQLEKGRPGTDRPFWKFADLATRWLVAWLCGCEYAAFTTTNFVWISSRSSMVGLFSLACFARHVSA